ncbi:Mucolipin-2 [Exaiptasia diaphana]|nr:Mucolipin-2 [Exaiptasia diaphana]
MKRRDWLGASQATQAKHLTIRFSDIYNDREYFDICSLLLGIAVLLVWCGLLRFLQYSPKYNALLLTVKASGPSVLRFMACSGILFMGFTLCGWLVLGPHHSKFRDTTITAECLYSLINGDDMFNTYALLTEKSGYAIWVYSKAYLYIFISLFIYVVLSLFIGIIADTYERLKDMQGYLPSTRLSRFVEESKDSHEHRTRCVTAPATCRRTESNTTSDTAIRHLSMDSTGAE